MKNKDITKEEMHGMAVERNKELNDILNKISEAASNGSFSVKCETPISTDVKKILIGREFKIDLSKPFFIRW